MRILRIWASTANAPACVTSILSFIVFIKFIIGFVGIPTLPLPLAGWPEAGLARPGQAGPGLAQTPTKTKGLRLEAGGRVRPWWLEAVPGPRASHLLFIKFNIFIMGFVGFCSSPAISLPGPREPPLFL